MQTIEKVDVFLCHNSKDKPFVKQIAEGLELELGLSHFLDDFAIPAGQEFLPWIETALAASTGCAIFLGANGWGPTHLWEAELALKRYRNEPSFRVYPIVLPGIRDEDMRRLGSGSVFSSINWTDFRGGTVDRAAINKLRNALLGHLPEKGRGPSELTPYLIRRDAQRWEESKHSNRSILYRGRQLKEAESLLASQPDLVSGDSITRFLSASTTAQRQRLQLLTAIAFIGVVILAVLGIQREIARRLALSRFVAAEARQAPSPDTGLLLAVQATRISEAPEAFGALIERLDALPYLRQVTRLTDAPVTSLAFDPKGTALYAGHANGKLMRLDLQTLTSKELSLPTSGGILAIDCEEQEVWVGLEDGRVLIYNLAGTHQEIPGIAAITTDGSMNKFRLGEPIESLQLDPTGRWVAIGDHSGRLLVADRKQRAVRWRKQLASERASALSFSSDGNLIAAGSSGGLIQIFDSSSGELRLTRTVARTGSPKAIQFAHNGDIRVIDDSSALTMFGRGDLFGSSAETSEQIDAPLLSTAVLGPRKEFGPLKRTDAFVLGLASGDIVFTPWNSGSARLRVPAHGRDVNAVALLQDGRMAATGASDGSIAIWDLQQRSGLVRRYAPPEGEIATLEYDPQGRMVVVTSSSESAQVFTRSASAWTPGIDLLKLTVAIAGEESVNASSSKPDAKGFVPVEEPPISRAAFHSNQSLAWATRRGALLYSRPGMDDRPLLLRERGDAIEDIQWSKSGRYLFVAQRGRWLICYDTRTSNSPKYVELPATIRTLVGSDQDAVVFLALDDDTIRKVDLNEAAGAADADVYGAASLSCLLSA